MERFTEEEEESSRIEYELTQKRIAIIRDRVKKIDTKNPSGLCWYCEESTGNERRFCNKECCDLWTLENE